MSAHVAIAILNYNGKRYLEQYLPFVLAATYQNKSVWLIDNASTDDSVAFVKTVFPEINIVINSGNFGFAEGYNIGLATITADYLVLLNNDAEVTVGFIESILEMMEHDATVAFVQPKILDINNRSTFEYAGAAGGLMDSVGYPFCRGRVLETVEKDNGQYDETARIFWASGCCLFARASVYKELGGMYTFLYMQNEDIDLCWRAQNKGYKIVTCSQSVVYHKGGGSLDWANPKKVFFSFRNNLVMIARNMPRQRLCWVLPFRWVIDSFAGIYYLMKGKGGTAKAIFAGQFAFLKWLFSTSANKWPDKRGFASCSGVLSKILVWEYFIRNRKTYTTLTNAKSNKRPANP